MTDQRQMPTRETILAQLAERMRRIANDDGTITPSESGMDLLIEESAEGIELDFLDALKPVAVRLKP